MAYFEVGSVFTVFSIQRLDLDKQVIGLFLESLDFGFDGIHWRELDEDISFESFAYEDSEPTPLQRFFLTHKEINVAEFARSLGMNATLLRNYINGFKKPSAERESAILAHIHKLGKEMISACF